MLAEEYVLIVPSPIIFSPGLTFTIEVQLLSSSLVILLGFSSKLDDINASTTASPERWWHVNCLLEPSISFRTSVMGNQ